MLPRGKGKAGWFFRGFTIMEDFESYYNILEVDESATADEIKAAFRRLSKEYHPDRVPEHLAKLRKDAEEKFKRINEAYSALGDPGKRSQYDAQREHSPGGGRTSPPVDTETGHTRPQHPPTSSPGGGHEIVVSRSWFALHKLRRGAKVEGSFLISDGRAGALRGSLRSNRGWLKLGQTQFDVSTGSREMKFYVDTTDQPSGLREWGRIEIQSNAGDCVVIIDLSIDGGSNGTTLAVICGVVLTIGIIVAASFVGNLNRVPDSTERQGLPAVESGVIATCAEVHGWRNYKPKSEFRPGEALCVYAEALNINNHGSIDVTFELRVLAPNGVVIASDSSHYERRTTDSSWYVFWNQHSIPFGSSPGVYTAQVNIRNNLTGQTGNSSMSFTVLGSEQATESPSAAGFWEGTFDDGAGAIFFAAGLEQSGVQVTGWMKESQAGYGDIFSDISGELYGTSIQFVKRYRSSGPQVSYSGTLDQDGASASGTWSVGVNSGQWRMWRPSPNPSTSENSTNSPDTKQDASSNSPLTSHQYRKYEGDSWQLSYPVDWRASVRRDTVVFAPDDGTTSAPQDSSALAFGLFVGDFVGSLDPADEEFLSTANRELTDKMLRANPQMRILRPAQDFRIGSKPALSTLLVGQSPRGGQEYVWLITVTSPRGLLYLAFVSPVDEFARTHQLFGSVAETLSFSP